METHLRSVPVTELGTRRTGQESSMEPRSSKRGVAWVTVSAEFDFKNWSSFLNRFQPNFHDYVTLTTSLVFTCNIWKTYIYTFLVYFLAYLVEANKNLVTQGSLAPPTSAPNPKFPLEESLPLSQICFRFMSQCWADSTSGGVILFPKDLANQIRHWSVYVAQMEKKGAPLGSYLNPLAAEWFSGPGLISCPPVQDISWSGLNLAGLPLHWTDPALGKVSPEVLEDMLPRMQVGKAKYFCHGSLRNLTGQNHGVHLFVQWMRWAWAWLAWAFLALFVWEKRMKTVAAQNSTSSYVSVFPSMFGSASQPLFQALERWSRCKRFVQWE